MLLRRAAAISLVCLLCVLLLAAWRAQTDVHREGRGAGQLAQLTRLLATLERAPADALDERLAALRDLGREGGLRHLQFRVEDGESGNVVAESAPPPAPSPAMRAYRWWLGLFARPHAIDEPAWVLERADGRRFRVALSTQPFNEQQEAFDELVGVTGVLLLYSLILFAAMYWAVRHAFVPLRQILEAIASVERHDYSVRLPALRVRELDVIGRALNHLAAALRQAQEARRRLSLKLLTLQEDERAHIARELHDELGQSLTAMRVDASYLQRRTAEQPELHAVAEELEQQCARVQQDVRNLLGWLGRPGDGAGGQPVPIRELLDDLVRSWARRPGQTVSHRSNVEVDGSAIPNGLALNLYRMTQEALTNVARHAAATQVDVDLRCDADGRLLWSVCDDGVGIASFADALQRGSGLAAIRERVWAHGGELQVCERASEEGARGLSLSASFPLPAAAHAVPADAQAKGDE